MCVHASYRRSVLADTHTSHVYSETADVRKMSSQESNHGPWVGD